MADNENSLPVTGRDATRCSVEAERKLGAACPRDTVSKHAANSSFIAVATTRCGSYHPG
jgi:hypothetical protein